MKDTDLKKEIREFECANCGKLLVTTKGKCIVENEDIYCGDCDNLLLETRAKFSERERCLNICEKIKQLDEDVGYYVWLQELTQKIKEGEGK